jgi:hypothetical protein
MSTDIVKRPAHRPPGINPGIAARRKMWKLADKCAEWTDEYVGLLGQVLEGKPIKTYDDEGKLRYTEYPELSDRIEADEKLMNRAYGRPHQAVEVDQTQLSVAKVVHEVRWMSPDPNDRSVVTVPEPD